MQRICLTNKLGFIVKILIVGQLMNKKTLKVPIIPYKGIRFSAITQPYNSMSKVLYILFQLTRYFPAFGKHRSLELRKYRIMVEIGPKIE